MRIAATAAEMLKDLLGTMQEFILTHGRYLAIIVLIALTGVGLPIPEEVLTIAAGVLSSAAIGKLNCWLAFFSCLFGALLGDCATYGIGRLLGTSYVRRHRFFARIMREERERQMERMIRRHGLTVFILARFVVGVRTPLYFAAGVVRVAFVRFFAVDMLSVAIVVSIFFWLSHFFGARIGTLVRESELAATIILLIIGAFGALYYFVWRKYTRQMHLDDTSSKG